MSDQFKLTSHLLERGKAPVLLSFIFMLVVGFMTITPAFAQAPPTIDLLEVEFWPDFDQPSMLVLMTGTLAEDVTLPVTLVLPVPADATINAVARVDENGGMFSDIDYDQSSSGLVTFTVTDPTFRIEYYAPYTADGNQRDYTFDWLSEIPVSELLVTVQQPAMADEISLDPAAGESSNRQDGLVYHSLPPQAVPAGQSFRLETSYELNNPQLTVETLANQQPIIPPAAGNLENPEANSDGTLNWPIIIIAAGLSLALVAGAWLLLSNRRSKRRVLKPQPVRRPQTPPPTSKATKGASSSNFCHECGRSLDPSDKFCRSCGTVVKGA
jgi:hypothetical protein